MAHAELRTCPFCGNYLVVDVTSFTDGREDQRHSFCAGVLGCHAWWHIGKDGKPIVVEERAARRINGREPTRQRR